MKILNIHGQEDNHSDAMIIGNRAGLRELRRTIDKALNQPPNTYIAELGAKKQYPWAKTDDGDESNLSVPEQVINRIEGGRSFLMASDGEGYTVQVVVCEDQWGYDGEKKPDPESLWNQEAGEPTYTWMHRCVRLCKRRKR